MQQDFAELTVIAVDSLFGQLTSRIYAALAYTGRKTLPDLVKQTHLNKRQVGTTLVVLVQHRLARHFAEGGQTFYEADGDAAYNICFRYPKLAKLVADRIGPAAASVIQKVALLGHTTPAELEKDLALAPVVSNGIIPIKKPNGVMTNGKPTREPSPHSDKPAEATEHPTESLSAPKEEVKSAITSVKHLHKLLDDLLFHGYLSITTTRQYIPERDLPRTLEEHALKDSQFAAGIKTPKDRHELSDAVIDLKRKWIDDADRFAERRSLPSLKQRKLNGKGGVQRVVASDDSGSDEERDAPVSRIKNDLEIQINFNKCNVLIRNQQMCDYAERHLGRASAQIFAALLRTFEDKMRRCYDSSLSREELEDEDEPPISQSLPGLSDILAQLPEDIDLAAGLPLKSDVQVNGVNGHSALNPVDVSDDNTTDSEAAPAVKPSPKPAKSIKDRGAHLEQHLRILEADPRAFVASIGTSWMVPLKRLTRSMVQHEIEKTVTALHGQHAGRIMRILQAQHVVDDKMLSQAAILKVKDARDLANKLLKAGYVELQEIPRDPNRTTIRTFFAFSYSPVQARKQILKDSYRAMARFLRRAEVQKASIASTIEKSERTDVVGNEEKYLSTGDLVQLKHWNRVESLILNQISRIDDLVACMRDFAPIEDPYIGNRPRVDEEEAAAVAS